MPISARDEILSRIQRSFAPAARSSAEDHAAVPRDYIQTGSLDPEARLDIFEDRLRDYGAEVYRCAPAQLPETIAIAMNAANVRSLVIPEDIGPNWLPRPESRDRSRFADQSAFSPTPNERSPQSESFNSDTKAAREKGALAPEANSAGFSFIRDENLSFADLDRAQGVLTTCAVAVALTGTIILRHGRSGRRAVTLIPDYHLCIVRASQVVETVPEAIRELESPARSPITTISGPSATSDIEMTRIKGVHGPRRLAVILVVA